MFETEINELKQKLKKTLVVREKIQKLHNECWERHQKDELLYFSNSIDSECAIYSKVIEKLKNMVRYNAAIDISINTYSCDSKEFKNACEKVLKLKNEDVTNHFIKILSARCSWEKEPRHEIKGDTIIFKLGYSQYLRLILNTLNILINGTIETDEVYKKCWEAIDGRQNTFVYRNTKITCYGNGKTKLVFGDDETLDKMKAILRRVKPKELN